MRQTPEHRLLAQALRMMLQEPDETGRPRFLSLVNSAIEHSPPSAVRDVARAVFDVIYEGRAPERPVEFTIRIAAKPGAVEPALELVEGSRE
jgi:hypothetical protein